MARNFERSELGCETHSPHNVVCKLGACKVQPRQAALVMFLLIFSRVFRIRGSCACSVDLFKVLRISGLLLLTSEPSLLPRSQQTKKQSAARMTNRAGANCLRMNETTIVYEQEFLEKGYDMQRHLHCVATATHKTRAI